MRPWLRRLRSFRRLPWSDQRLFVQAIAWLGLARLAINTVPFARLTRRLGPSGIESAPEIPDSELVEARRIAWAVQTASCYTPWKSNCLPGAIAAKHLLRRRGIASTLYLGAAFKARTELEAHAWLRCGSLYVTGGAGHLRFGTVAVFGSSSLPLRPTEPGVPTEALGPTEFGESPEPAGPTERGQSTEPAGPTGGGQSTGPAGPAGRVTRAVSMAPPGPAISRQERSDLMPHRPALLWFTGLSASGKTTIAEGLEFELNKTYGAHTYLLDGDRLRTGLNRDLDYSEEGRRENIRRAGEVAGLLCDAGLIVLAAFISPYAGDRQAVRARLPQGMFLEIFVDCPLAVCESRDPKGLYARARKGLLTEFTGIDAPYEPPDAPEIILHSDQEPASACVQHILDYLERLGTVPPARPRAARPVA